MWVRAGPARSRQNLAKGASLLQSQSSAIFGPGRALQGSLFTSMCPAPFPGDGPALAQLTYRLKWPIGPLSPPGSASGGSSASAMKQVLATTRHAARTLRVPLVIAAAIVG